jgi:UV DNA damage endonuclease
MNLGLCCLFKEEDIKFKTFTLKNFSLQKADEVYSHNIEQLQKAFNYCNKNNIASYRVSSDILPKFGTLLKRGDLNLEFLQPFLEKLQNLNSHNLLLSFHPDQFVNMGSPKEEVIKIQWKL